MENLKETEIKNAGGDPITVSMRSMKANFSIGNIQGEHGGRAIGFLGELNVSKKCFMVEVPDRTAATLEALILQHRLPGTHIISDGWAAYRNIAALKRDIPAFGSCA